MPRSCPEGLSISQRRTKVSLSRALSASQARRTRPLRPSRGQVLAALGVAAAVGVTAFYAGPYVAAAGGWLAGLAGTLAAQAGLALRRLMKTATT